MAARAAPSAALAGALLLAGPAAAQEVAVNLGDAPLTLRSLQILGAVTLLSLAPAIAVTLTCFPFIVTVLSILRQAIGVQQAPPSMMIVSLALFLTWYVMDPIFLEAWAAAQPAIEGNAPLEQGLADALVPFRAFMEARTAPGTLAEMAATAPRPAPLDGPPPWSVLVPSFLLSEITRAFEIGFLVFLPFLLIDLIVASVLMSMGMMMVPPAVVSLPFKLAFFVLADGWTLLAGALVRGYTS
ncbi:flagellar type III secretion system pore protein FliP [Rhodovulum sp. DZ06]|uniref:flagellar type III secretion system pore protein FliP n=1 Tax=Rhodovulum sp. DZ06 TaxID=3425126 RepID=UPI003D32C066